MSREKILIVDDSEMNRSILSDMLIDEYDIAEAEDGVKTVEILKNERESFTLVLLDIVMPEMDGFGVLTVMNQNKWIDELPVIMVSAETASAQIERAYELGATDFIMRPFDASIVHRRVVNTILLYAKQKKLLGIIEEQVNEKEQSNSLMVDILSHIVEFRNGESGLHIRNVRVLTDFLLHKINERTDRYPLSETEMSVISMASALHDIGKIGIDEKILNKPGKLTDEEFAIMKSHSVIGANMLEDLPLHKNNPLVKSAYEICRWHHERYDGRGYPDGLKGDKIPISAQIVALADVYDALTSERVYKKAIPHDEAVEMILAGKCGSFNPLMLKCLEENSKDIRDLLASSSPEKKARQEIRSFAEATHYKGNTVSDRTLRLLDYERMKHNFYAAMTDEIQFEYISENETLNISPLGAKKLGLDENIKFPWKNEKLKALLGDDWFNDLSEKFKKMTPETPEFRQDCSLNVSGESRWFTVIIKVIWEDEIPPRISGAIGKLVDINDVHNKLGEFEEMALKDPLTGLLNRTGSRERIEHKISCFPKHKYALVCFDVDYFKNANDNYGHLFGDKVLREIAQRLLHSTRAYDICSRIGGDEFLIFLEYDTDINPIIARIFRTLSGKIDNFDLSVSMGVAEMQAKCQTYEDLFHKADLALYFSKQSGRAQYHIYDDSMKDVLIESGCEDDGKEYSVSAIDEYTDETK